MFLTECFDVINAQQRRYVSVEKKMLKIPAGNYKPFFVTKSGKPIKVATFKMDESAVTNTEFLLF
ncbi:MAG: hypothetical protein ABI543_16050 [Ignavibacteria bacterium]